jgi:hypothetical protein
MSKRHFSSMQKNTLISQANNSVGRLHQSVSRALSHPTEQLMFQAESSLEHAEQAFQAAQGSEDGLAVEYTEGMLAAEKSRLAAIDSTELM